MCCGINYLNWIKYIVNYVLLDKIFELGFKNLVYSEDNKFMF